MVQVRKSYDMAYKRKILEEAETSSVNEVCRKYNLDERMVRRWKNDSDLDSCEPKRCRSPGGGRKPTIELLEDQILDWIVERRSRALVVRRKDIQDFALVLAEDENLQTMFKASSRWLDGFMERYELSLRRSTTLFKLEDDEVARRAVSFKRFVDALNLETRNLRFAVAMDETAVYFGENSQTTVEIRGSTSVYIPSTGYESCRLTCVLGFRLDGVKLPPMLVIKGTTNRIVFRDGILVMHAEKAWCTQAVLRSWIEWVLPPVIRGGSRGLLVWDSASTHRARSMSDYLSTSNVDQVMIPSGTTPYLQSLDIAVNKPFKDYVREELNAYFEQQRERTSRGNYVKPSIEEVGRWVKRAWDRISDEVIRNAMRAAYLIPGQSFDDTHICHHDRLGPLVRRSLGDTVQPSMADIDEEDDPELIYE